MAKKKCSFCNHKLGLITFTCPCGITFCVKHQTKHSHNCSNKSIQKIEKTTQRLFQKSRILLQIMSLDSLK